MSKDIRELLGKVHLRPDYDYKILRRKKRNKILNPLIIPVHNDLSRPDITFAKPSD